MSSRCLLLAPAAALALAFGAFAAAPAVDDPVPVETNGFPSRVEPMVPVGKALIFPITAADADGDLLEYSVQSSNPDVLVRVRSGLPKLILNVSHAVGTGTAEDPEFTGTLEFALLRDFTPITSDIIGGFAQGRYYDGQIFHRFANLDATEQPNGSFIFQGGDPTGTGSGGPGFQFENEFKAPLIFTGRGQLAMANAGSSSQTFRGSNGSQFFITDGQPRFLDFNHTIFAQLLRGWELLPKFRTLPRSASDKPTQDVRLVSARVEPDFSDAVLTISAVAPGSATITVSVTDGTSAPVVKAFSVIAFEDERNSPPFLQPIPSRVAPREAVFEVPLKAVDLERDFLFYQNRVIAGQGQSSGSGNPVRAVGNTGYTGLLTLGNSITEYDMTYRGTIDGPAAATEDMKPADIGIGDRGLNAEAVSFTAAPGQVLSGQVVATFSDSDPRGNGSTTTATIRWGDGSAPATTAGIIARDSSRPGIARFTVAATHTYQNAGIYPVNVDLQSSRGAKQTVRGQAVVTAGPLAAIGVELAVKGKLENRRVASFTDLNAGRPADYSAEIAWGDGEVSAGTVKRDKTGGFQVAGTHRYIDPEDFAIAVRIRKNGDPVTQAIAWSRVDVSGFVGTPHLPPFSFSHLIGQFTQTAVGTSTNLQPLRMTTGDQTFVIGELLVLNSGNKASPKGSFQFFLSADTALNRTPVQIDDPNNPGSMITTPADLPVTIGEMATGKLQSLAPGQGIRFVFDQSTDEDRRLRLPLRENGSAFNLLAVLTYSDQLAKNLPISKAVVFGPFNGFKVKPTSLVLREAAVPADSTRTFTVKMDSAPAANVTINLTASDAAQLTFTPATLTFTPVNFETKQTVTVTATDDGTADGTKSVRITLAPAVSADPQWKGIDPDDVTVSVLDKITIP